jgi:hypothetical protein
MLIAPESLTAVIILNVVLFVVYLLALLGLNLSSNYINQNQAYTRRKVQNIRMMKADVDVLAASCDDDGIKAALAGLSEDIRYSDPMSDPSLENLEDKLRVNISTIGEMLSTGATGDEVMSLIREAKLTLKVRNEKCKILK